MSRSALPSLARSSGGLELILTVVCFKLYVYYSRHTAGLERGTFFLIEDGMAEGSPLPNDMIHCVSAIFFMSANREGFHGTKAKK